MKLIEIIASAFGKIWGFATTLILIAILFGIGFFAISIFLPEQLINAINILKNLLKIA